MVGYNSSKYDLNIIKKYFITHIGAEKQVTVAKKQGRIMFLSTPFHPQISSLRTFVIIWGQARVMRGGWKCMEAARQNHGCHMSGLTVLTNWIMMACRWIVVGSQNWKTSLSCCWRSMRTASGCSGAGNEKIWLLAGVLQQSGCKPLPGSTRKKERILLRALCRHFRRRCVTPGCVHAVSSLRDASR